MGAFSRDEATKIVTFLQGKTLKVALYLTEATEISGTGYARQPVTLSNAVSVGSGIRTSNVNDISFGAAGSDWAAPPAKVTWVKVIDQADSKVVWAGELPTAAQISIITGQPYEIKSGALGLLISTYD